MQCYSSLISIDSTPNELVEDLPSAGRRAFLFGAFAASLSISAMPVYGMHEFSSPLQAKAASSVNIPVWKHRDKPHVEPHRRGAVVRG